MRTHTERIGGGCGEVNAVSLADSARLALEEATVEGRYGTGVLVGAGKTLTATGSQFRSHPTFGIDVHADGEARIVGSGFSANAAGLLVRGGDVNLTVRSTGFRDNDGHGIYLAGLPGRVDLGGGDDLGGNVLVDNGLAGLGVEWSSGTVDAVGNRWEAGQQGAGGDGSYKPRVVAGPFGTPDSPNLYVQHDGAAVQL